MAELLDPDRKAELRRLAALVDTVEDARRTIQEQQLKADPQNSRSVFYYGKGVVGAGELASREGFVRLEQTERGYFLDQATKKLSDDGKVERGALENKALFGDPAAHPRVPGLWGEASQQYAELSKGPAFAFPDLTRTPEHFQQTAFYTAELPALSRNALIESLTAVSYTRPDAAPGMELTYTPTKPFESITPAFVVDRTYGLDEAQVGLLRAGEKAGGRELASVNEDYATPRLTMGGPLAATAPPSPRVPLSSPTLASTAPETLTSRSHAGTEHKAPQPSPAEKAKALAERFSALSPAERARDPELRNAQSQLTAITAQLGHRIADAGVRAAVVEELQADIAAQLAAGAEFDPAMMAEVAAERASESPASLPEPVVAARPDRER